MQLVEQPSQKARFYLLLTSFSVHSSAKGMAGEVGKKRLLCILFLLSVKRLVEVAICFCGLPEGLSLKKYLNLLFFQSQRKRRIDWRSALSRLVQSLKSISRGSSSSERSLLPLCGCVVYRLQRADAVVVVVLQFQFFPFFSAF